MADDKRKASADAGPDSKPKQTAAEPKRLSDELVENIKRGILFGEVGYKRQPKEHQFKKGHSGNPKGRPKMPIIDEEGDLSLDALVLNEAKRAVAVREGEEVKTLTALGAVLRSQYATATIKQNAYAQKHIIERYGRAERERRRQIQRRIEVWTQYVAEGREAIAEAERNGEPPPALLPHPDDVVIDRANGVRFIGPLTQEDLRDLEKACRLRDVLLMQDALDQRQRPDQESGDSLDGPGTALLFAVMIDRSVPDRYKLNDSELNSRMMRCQRIPKRQLLKDVYRAWRSLGMHLPRGKVFPPLRAGKWMLELLFEVRQRTDDGRLDPDDKTPEELHGEIADLILERQRGLRRGYPCD